MDLPLLNGLTFLQTLSNFSNTSSKFRSSSIFAVNDTHFQRLSCEIDVVLLLAGFLEIKKKKNN